jgi:hypothetical protein
MTMKNMWAEDAIKQIDAAKQLLELAGATARKINIGETDAPEEAQKTIEEILNAPISGPEKDALINARMNEINARYPQSGRLREDLTFLAGLFFHANRMAAQLKQHLERTQAPSIVRANGKVPRS